MRKGETVYANNFRYGPKWMMELILKQSTGPTSFTVQLQDGRLPRRHQDHLIPQSSVIQEPIANQEVPKPQATKQPELHLEEPLMQPTEPEQSVQDSQRNAILLGTDKYLDIWLILLLSDLLCYRTETLKNCKLSCVVDVIVSNSFYSFLGECGMLWNVTM